MNLKMKRESVSIERSKCLESSQHAVSAPPYARLSPELLQQIFLLLIPGRRVIQTAIPPLLSSPPWVLGQVSSTWRYISRSMTELWGTATLRLTDKWTSPGIFQLALITLPDVCKIDVHVVNAFSSAKVSLVPCLTRVDELHLQLDDPPLRLVELWSTLPRDALSRVTTLDLSCTFRFRGPADIDALTQNKTVQLFGKEARLRFLKIDMPKGILPAVLAIDLPLEHLTSLCISCRSEEDSGVVAQSLSRCIALHHLDLRFYMISFSKHYEPITTLHQIESLTLLGFVPSFLFLSQCIWNGLDKLCLEQISLPITILCRILSQCPQIKHLSCCISSSSDEASHTVRGPAISIALPHLRTLSLTLQQVTIFSLLQTPVLEKMIITTLENLDLLPISNFITRSGCVVDSFMMSSAQVRKNYRSGLRELLLNLDHATSFSMRGGTVHDDILNDIASGAVLPNVRSLTISTSNFNAYMTMVERRLQWEQGLGEVRIGVIEGSAPDVVDEMVMGKLRKVGEKHSMRCQYFCEDFVDIIL